MRSTGIRRKVDDLGRVVIPAGIRRSLNIREGDEVEVHVDGENVVLAKPTIGCVFCGSEDGPLQTYRGRHVCRSCVASVGVLDENLRERAREAATDPRPSGWQPPAAVIEDRAPSEPERPAASAPAPPRRDDDPDPAPAPRVETAPPPERDAERHPAHRRDDRPSDDARDDDLYDPASTTAW